MTTTNPYATVTLTLSQAQTVFYLASFTEDRTPKQQVDLLAFAQFIDDEGGLPESWGLYGLFHGPSAVDVARSTWEPSYADVSTPEAR